MTKRPFSDAFPRLRRCLAGAFAVSFLCAAVEDGSAGFTGDVVAHLFSIVGDLPS